MGSTVGGRFDVDISRWNTLRLRPRMAGARGVAGAVRLRVRRVRSCTDHARTRMHPHRSHIPRTPRGEGGGVMERGRMYVHDDGSIRDATGDEFDEVEIVEAHNGLREVCTTLRARIAELEAWKADSLLRWQQAVTLGGQQLERIAELEREKGELAARIEAMEPFVAMGAAHTPGAYGPACRDCGAPMIGVERCQHCGGKH